MVIRYLYLFLFLINSLIAHSQTSSIGTYSWLPPRASAPTFNISNERPTYLGDFKLNPDVAFYIPVTTGFARARISAYTDDGPWLHQRILIRGFDVEERLIHWQYQLVDSSKPTKYYPKDNYVNGVAALPDPNPSNAVSSGTLTTYSDATFALVGNGVHQIRVNSQGGGDRFRAGVMLSENLDYGVSFQAGYCSNWKNQWDTFYFYIPPQATVLNIYKRTGYTEIRDPGGSIYHGNISFSPLNVGEVWSVIMSSDAVFAVWDFPLILCNTSAAANSIKASIELGPDGEAIAHKFQKRLLQVKKQMLSPANVGPNFIYGITNFSSYINSFLSDPERNIYLVSQSGLCKKMLDSIQSQNINPASRWGGALFSDTSGRWDTYAGVKQLAYYANGHNMYSAPQNMGFLSTLPASLNPYFNEASMLRCRAASRAFLDLLTVSEGEYFNGKGGLGTHYAFFINTPMQAFAEISPYMHDSIREIWTEALRRIYDKQLCEGFPGEMNQGSFLLPAAEEFYIGCKDTMYKNLSRECAARFVSYQNPAGWFNEQYGPSQSYIGITHENMANYLQLSNHDTVVYKSLIKSYDFFNHTVAPEPKQNKNTKAIGGFNFAHRIGENFKSEQNGARELYIHVPEIGAWVTKTPAEKTKDSIDNINTIVSTLTNINTQNASAQVPGKNYKLYKYHGPANTSYVWPAQRSPFFKIFSNQMVAVKTEEYYTNIYVGSPSHEAENQYKYDYRKIDSKREFNPDSVVTSTKRWTSSAPIMGAGLSTFWNEDYGVSVMAGNWSPSIHNGLVATFNSGSDSARYFENYYLKSFTTSTNSDHKKLVCSGSIDSVKIDYDREYKFYDGYLDIDITLKNKHNYSALTLAEHIPFVRGKHKLRGTFLSSGEDTLLFGRRRTFYQLADSLGYGTIFLFDSIEKINFYFGMKSKWEDYRIDHIQKLLPNSGNAGDSLSYGYHLIPVNKLTKGMIAQWRWRGNTHDNAGYDMHAHNLGAFTYDTTSRQCSFINLNGINQYAALDSFRTPSHNISIVFWAQSITNKWNDSLCLISKGNSFAISPNPSSSASGMMLEGMLNINGNNEKISFDLSSISNFKITDWHMYSITYNENTGLLKLFVDTLLQAQKTITNTFRKLTHNIDSMFIGRDNSGQHFFYGNIGETRLYNAPLHDSIIKQLFSKTSCLTVYNFTNEYTKNKNELILFPNPSTEEVTLICNNKFDNARISIIDLTGKTIDSIENINGNSVVLKPNVAKGIYFIKVCFANEQQTLKWIKW